MKLNQICLDFDNKTYVGADGKKLQDVAFKILACVLRENLDTDIDHVMNTSEEEELAEALERINKVEIKHTWDHFNELINVVQGMANSNRELIQGNIERTGQALKEMISLQNEQKKEVEVMGERSLEKQKDMIMKVIEEEKGKLRDELKKNLQEEFFTFKH